MPLTPADVHNVAFKKPSIGKRGYDEDEVDAFLDVVEAELSRLIEENSQLTGRLSEFEAGGSPAPRVEAAAPRRRHRGTRRGPGAGGQRQRSHPGGPAAAAGPGDGRPAHRGGEGRIRQAAGGRQEPLRGAGRRRHHPRRGRRAGQPDQGRSAGRRGQGPVRRGARQARHRSGRPGEEDPGSAELREGVPRPAEELDQRPAGAARRRRQRAEQVPAVVAGPGGE